MSRQPAAVRVPMLAAVTPFLIGVLACVVLAGSYLGNVGAERQAGIRRTFRTDSCRAHAPQDEQWPWNGACFLDSVAADAARCLGGNPSTSPDAAGHIGSPILSNRTSWPPTEGLCEDRPTQVRVDVRRWRTAILADGGVGSHGSHLSYRRSHRGAFGVPCPSRSLQVMFCTWVI